MLWWQTPGQSILGLIFGRCSCIETATFHCQFYQPVTAAHVSCIILGAPGLADLFLTDLVAQVVWMSSSSSTQPLAIYLDMGFSLVWILIAGQGCKGETQQRIISVMLDTSLMYPLSILSLLNDAGVSFPSCTLPGACGPPVVRDRREYPCSSAHYRQCNSPPVFPI